MNGDERYIKQQIFYHSIDDTYALIAYSLQYPLSALSSSLLVEKVRYVVVQQQIEPMAINSGTNYNYNDDDNGEHEHEHDADDINNDDSDDDIDDDYKNGYNNDKRYNNITYSYMKMWKLFLDCNKNSICKCYFTEMIKR